MCRHRMRSARVPLATAASTNGSSRSASTTPRTSRLTRGTSAIVIARMTLPRLARVSAISAIAISTAGIDISPSMTRISNASAQRLKPVEADRQPQAGRRQRHAEPHRQRYPGAVNRAAVNVAAEHVGAKPVLRRRPAQPLDRRQGLRVDGAEIGGEDRRQRHQAEQYAADDDRRMTAEVAPDRAASRGAGGDGNGGGRDAHRLNTGCAGRAAYS